METDHLLTREELGRTLTYAETEANAKYLQRLALEQVDAAGEHADAAAAAQEGAASAQATAVASATVAAQAKSDAAASATQAVSAKQVAEAARDTVVVGVDTVAAKAAEASASADVASGAAASAVDGAATAVAQATVAVASATSASQDAVASAAAKAAAEAARDAALIQVGSMGVYVDEPTGRAAVADGQAFKVQGSGDVAAYEYRRVNAGASTLISTYPNAQAAVSAGGVIDQSYDEDGESLIRTLAPDVNGAKRLLSRYLLDGTFVANLALRSGSGIDVVQGADGYFTLLLGAISSALNLAGAFIDPTYDDPDVLYRISAPDAGGVRRVVLTIMSNGDIQGNFASSEVVAARGVRSTLAERLGAATTDYGMPRSHVWGEWYLRETRQRTQAINRNDAGTQLVIASMGDSWTHGRTYWTQTTAVKLRTLLGDAGGGWCGFGYPVGQSVFINGNVDPGQISDPVFTGTGWLPTYNGAVSPDLALNTSSTAGDRISVTGPANCSAVNLYYLGGAGVVQYRWNGGSWTTLNLTGSGLQVGALAGLPSIAWTLDLEVVSGSCSLCGLDVQKSGNGVRWHKLGGTGSRAEQWAGVDATQWQAGLSALNPRLVTFMLGTNDQGVYDAATYKGYMQTVISRIKAAVPYADVLLMVPPENILGRARPMADYQEAAYQLAVANKCAFLNLQYVFGESPGEYGPTTGRPWFVVDNTHPSTAGGRAIIDAVYRLLITR